MSWLPKNPYPEKISDDISSTMVSSPKYQYWQEGAMVAAGNIFTRGNEPCPHTDIHVTGADMKKRECILCWYEFALEMGLRRSNNG